MSPSTNPPEDVTPRPAKSSATHFAVRCAPCISNDHPEGRGLTVAVSQRLRSHGVEQTWETITIHCEEEADGSLVMKVVVSNPDWEERLQIASLRSRPADANSVIALACNLEHRRV